MPDNPHSTEFEPSDGPKGDDGLAADNHDVDELGDESFPASDPPANY